MQHSTNLDDASPMEVDASDDPTSQIHFSRFVSPLPDKYDTRDEIDVLISSSGEAPENSLHYGHTEPSDNNHQITTNDVRNRMYSKYPVRHPLNTWVRSKRTRTYFIRCQSRTVAQRNYVSKIQIGLAELQKLSMNNGRGLALLFHATFWKNAKKIRRKGPRLSGGALDLAPNGAFYLNRSYDDCYNWFLTNDKLFKGKHAMLIYKFDPEILSKKGIEVLDKEKWKNLVIESNKRSKPFAEDWIYTYQNSNPGKVYKSGDKIKVRRMENGQEATQLIVYSESMCRKIHKCLIGCVFYEKTD